MLKLAYKRNNLAFELNLNITLALDTTSMVSNQWCQSVQQDWQEVALQLSTV